ncbi:HAD-IC family P-type ATPase [Candidatus Roizmanbacteria bacterium]|nr:HAD-IC family P-type ATPase [Candidatus Roizmanbacteria bacterium]
MENLEFYTAEPSDEILKSLQSSRQGLTEHDALLRQAKYGKNEIISKEIHWYDIFFRQFSSPFIYLLILASLLAIYLGEHTDGAMVLLFVMINALLGFYQEFRSEEALKILKRYITSKTRLIRDNKETFVESANIVPGDIVVLNPGDKIPADLRLIETTDLTVDETILTGESTTTKKVSTSLSNHVHNIYKAQNLGFSGTVVVSGKGIGVVFLIGKKTTLGEISRLTIETKHISSFEKGIARFSSYILRLIVITLILVFAANILIKGPQADIARLIIFSIALAVSVIPEALPVVITFSLSHGALKLAKNKVVVKRLSAIEDLGGIEILCSDKTGTLTENRLSVDEIYSKDNQILLFYAALASSQRLGKDDQVDSFDRAIWKKLSDKNKRQIEGFKKITEIPFDPVRKRNSILVKQKDIHLLIIRGAPEEILKLSHFADQRTHTNASLWIQNKGKEGKRVLAMAFKKIKMPEDDLIGEEKNLEFIGCISFHDPIKPTAFTAIKKAESLGVNIKILTGDSKEVAATVAYEVGLIQDKNKVITGDEFISQTQDKQHQSVNEYQVFARVTPEQKYKIIQLLEEKHEVGFLGEGINDAPALKIANVALVVDSAADIARDTADIVLLHKSLQVIVEGIRLGRETFSNTNKYIKATLSSNFGNFYTVAIASLLVNYLPLLPLQLLLINLLTDFPMIAIAADSVETAELKNPKSYDIREIALIATILGVVSSFFDFMFFILFSRISASVLQTNWFIGSILTELVFLFSIRTKLPFLKAAKPPKIILSLSLLAAAIAVTIPFTSFGQNIFSFITPSLSDLILIGTVVFFYLIATEVVKVLYYRSSFYLKTQSKI